MALYAGGSQVNEPTTLLARGPLSDCVSTAPYASFGPTGASPRLCVYSTLCFIQSNSGGALAVWPGETRTEQPPFKTTHSPRSCVYRCLCFLQIDRL